MDRDTQTAIALLPLMVIIFAFYIFAMLLPLIVVGFLCYKARVDLIPYILLSAFAFPSVLAIVNGLAPFSIPITGDTFVGYPDDYAFFILALSFVLGAFFGFLFGQDDHDPRSRWRNAPPPTTPSPPPPPNSGSSFGPSSGGAFDYDSSRFSGGSGHARRAHPLFMTTQGDNEDWSFPNEERPSSTGQDQTQSVLEDEDVTIARLWELAEDERTPEPQRQNAMRMIRKRQQGRGG